MLTQGEIVLSDTSDVINQITDDDEPLDLFQSGFFELQLNGFESSILLSAVPSGNLKFTYNLFQVPVLGFRVRCFELVSFHFLVFIFADAYRSPESVPRASSSSPSSSSTLVSKEE